MFVLKSDYGTAGDQEQAIQELIKQINEGQERCVLMGVTGSGKTFAMANIIERLQIPTLISVSYTHLTLPTILLV